jgi:hypothetical protein
LGLSEAQLATRPSSDRWPLWATVGHLACQRISGLCGLAGEPGAETTPFPNALYHCPGDEDLVHVLTAPELGHALDSTFAIVEQCLDGWTFDMLDELVTRQFGEEKWESRRGSIIQRVFTHDVWHFSELNESLAKAGLQQINLWD